MKISSRARGLSALVAFRRCGVVVLLAGMAACGGGGESSTPDASAPVNSADSDVLAPGVAPATPSVPVNESAPVSTSPVPSNESVPVSTSPVPSNQSVPVSTSPAPVQDPLSAQGARIEEPPLSPSAPVLGSKSLGTWSALYDWPLVSIHSALLPDGRVMTYGTHLSSTGYTGFKYDVFDPKIDPAAPESHLTLDNITGTYIFCSAQVLLPLSGELLLTGGDVFKNGNNTERGNSDANLFNPIDNSLRATSKMNLPRWYGTATVLPNADVYVQGGIDGEKHPEIRGADGNFRLLEGINTLKTDPGGARYFTNNYPRNFVAPNGKVFGLDHHYMYEIDPYAPGDNGRPGSVKLFDAHWNIPHTGGGSQYRGWALTSTTVMYKPGKILQIGGSRANVTEIDFNGPTPVLRDLPPLNKVRQWSNATVLPDGKVFVSGGSVVNQLSDPTGSPGEILYETAIYDPATQTWSPGAPIAVPRLYHSSTLLLPDGTLLSGGGGLPGPVTNLNAQIYYPGYLFREDGSRAVRPIIDQVPDALPAVVEPGASFNLTSREAAGIRRVTMIKSGAVTHSIDMDQRFLEPSFTVSGNQIRVDLPKNKFETPPGFYMVFIIDAAGTPSRSKMIRINPAS